MFSSRLTAYFRRKGVAVTDRRVQKMNEILTNIKFVKMYAWVKAFAQDIHSMYPPAHLPVAMVTQVTTVFCLVLFPLRDPGRGAEDLGADGLLPEHHCGRGSCSRRHRQCGNILHPPVARIRPNCSSGTKLKRTDETTCSFSGHVMSVVLTD